MERKASIDEKIEYPSPVATSASLWSRDVEYGGKPDRKSLPLSPLGRLSKHISKCRRSGKLNDAESEATYGTITRKLDTCPDGYCKVATFQSSDPNFLQYRGFSYLHCRLLSSLQYEVEQLENELEKLDQWEEDNNDPGGRLSCKQIDDKHTDVSKFPPSLQLRRCRRTRPQVFADIRTKLLEYDEALLKMKSMSSLQKPSNRDYNSVKSWFMNHEPLVQSEWAYIRKKEDIVTLRTGREGAGFEGLIERLLSKVDRTLRKLDCNIVRDLFMTAELRQKSSDPELRYYAPARVDTLVGIIITLIIFVMLVLPVVAMYEITNIGNEANAFEAMAMLILFTLLFGFAMSLLTKAKRHELFAASAAYCGVLVVFISNFSTQTVEVVNSKT